MRGQVSKHDNINGIGFKPKASTKHWRQICRFNFALISLRDQREIYNFKLFFALFYEIWTRNEIVISWIRGKLFVNVGAK